MRLFCFPGLWVAKLGAVLAKAHVFQFFWENYTIVLALKFSSYVSDYKQHQNPGPLRMALGRKNPL